MAGIVFYFEDYDRDVYSGRQIDLDAWRYAAMAAGDIDKMLVINQTEITIPPLGGGIAYEILDTLPNLDGRVVCLDTPWGATESTSLWKFDHNVDWYVFGPAQGWGTEPPYPAVHIPQGNNRVALHSIHIASVVMMHRHSVKGAVWAQ